MTSARVQRAEVIPSPASGGTRDLIPTEAKDPVAKQSAGGIILSEARDLILSPASSGTRDLIALRAWG